jgi:tRNA U34 5-carboxymethylaminomethyl modifying GTPase MnmE/TrmE
MFSLGRVLRAANTIFALSTPSGRSAIAVIRLSGPKSELALRALTKQKPPPAPRTATVRVLRDPNEFGVVIDKAMVLWLPKVLVFVAHIFSSTNCAVTFQTWFLRTIGDDVL